MNISNSQVNRLRHFVRAGLRSLFRPEPQTAVEWADANYYLPKESAYQEGRWETLPFQRAIMNAMGSDYIREVNVVKSARVGYGCIQDADAQREGINASARYPKNWVTPASTSVVKGQSTTLTVAFQPEGATDKSFRAVSADKTKATVSVSGMTITVKGVAAGKVNIPVVSGNGELAVVAEITVTDS